MNDLLISIVMPVRNAGPYLKECLNSIVQQSYPHWELHITNDHSTDDSESIMKLYQEKHTNIYVHANKGRGIIDALKTSHSKIKGQFITRMDADDVMPKEKLINLVHVLLNHGKGHVATGKVSYFSTSILGDGFQKYERWLNAFCTLNNHFSEIYKECVIPSPCWMMYKEDFEAIGGFENDQYPEDYDLCFRMYKHKMDIVSSQEILHRWRDHSERASRNDENYTDNRFLEMKIQYFLELDYNTNSPLVVWGAGKKGKRIAQLLQDQNVDFHWVTNNPKKIGLSIYDKIIEDESFVFTLTSAQVIVAVANPEEQEEISKKLKEISSHNGVFKFC